MADVAPRTPFALWQAAAWPDTAAAMADALGAHVGAAPPPPGRVAEGPGGALVRVGPLKWWLIDAAPPALDPALGPVLDLSAEQVALRLAGPGARDALARVVAVDLRDRAFPPGSFAATGGRHMMLKLRRLTTEEWEVYVMRSFAAHALEEFAAAGAHA